MGLLDDGVLDGMRIERMIFHVVGPEESDLQLMDEVDVSGFESFFLDRVKETNIGNRFEFIGKQSGVRPALYEIKSDAKKFVGLTKEIAETFHASHQAVSSSKGAFIVAQLGGISVTGFALIKFDDQRVLRFRQERTQAGRMRAVVSEIDNTFIEDRKAMQKSALIILTDEGGDLAVYDRTDKRNITDYFKAFLGVRRLWTSEDATKRMVSALEDAMKAIGVAAPENVRRSWRGRLFDAVQTRESIEPGEPFNVFGAEVFGAFWQNEGFRAKVDQCVHGKKISGEVIEIAKAVIRKPNVRRLKTAEDIVISYPKQLDDAKNIVSYQPRAGGGVTITISTSGIVDDTEALDDVARR